MYYIYAKTFLLMQRMKTVLPRTKWGRFGSFAVVLLVIVFGVHFASAVTLEGFTDSIANAFAFMFLQLATLFLKLSVFVLRFIIELGGYNGYITSSAVDIGWVIVRDIANMFFVVALLVIAFGTILGLENYEWKKMLGKLFLAALLVNFSRTICGLIIDVSQVVMITFINGVAATAGGNLINAFKLDGILKLSADYSATGAVSISDKGNVFMAAVAGLFFSSLVMAILLVYLFILLARMIVLWVLIVLSPLAFALTALPQTKSKYFDEWWKEFSRHVIIGPMLAFFLWLSFAVIGAGDIHTEISGASDSPVKLVDTEVADETNKIGSNAGITDAMTWDSMANFFIAIAMLWIGAEKAQELGATGSGALAGARGFAKGVAKVATGVSAGMWAGKKGKELGIKGAKYAGMKMPGIGGDAWVRRGKTIKAKYQIGKHKRQVKRDEWVQGQQGQAAKQGGKMGRLRHHGAGLLSSTARKDAIAEKWTQAAEDTEAEHKKRIGTGKTSAGKARTEAKVGLAIATEAKDLHGGRKQAEKREEMTREGGRLEHLTDNMADNTRRKKQAEELAQRRTGEKQSENQRQFQEWADMSEDDFNKNIDTLDIQGTVPGMEKASDKEIKAKREEIREEGNKYRKQGIESSDLEAQIQSHDKISTRSAEIRTAEARAGQLKKEGKLSEAGGVLFSVHSKHQAEDADSFKTLGYSGRVAQSKNLSKTLAELNKKEEESDDGSLNAVDTSKRENLRKDMMKLVNIAAAAGKDEYEDVLHGALDNIHGGEEYSVTSTNHGSQLMSAILGKKVDAGSFEEDEKELFGLYQEGAGVQGQVVMTQLADNLKALASNGYVKAAGSLQSDLSTDDTKFKEGDSRNSTLLPSAYTFRSEDNSKGIESEKRKDEEWFTTRMDSKVLTDLNGFVGTARSTDSAGKVSEQVSEITESQIDQMIDVLGNFGDTRAVSAGVSGAFAKNTADAELSDDAKTGFQEMLKKLEEKYGDDVEKKRVFKHLFDTRLAGLAEKVDFKAK